MEEKKEKVLDLTKIFPTLLRGWKYYTVATIIAIAFSMAFIFTIPRYYTCKIMLAPEAVDNKGGLNSIMSSFGIGNLEGTDDAISPMLYPDLMESSDFVTSLFDVNITTKDGTVSTSYYDYKKNHSKSSWYGECMEKIKNLTKSEEQATSTTKKNDFSPAFMPTKEQSEIAEAITGSVKYDYDKKTGVVSITVTDQDPLVCALIADTVSNRLQAFIMDYRTKKARVDLKYSERIYETAKEEYEKSNAMYSSAVDGTWDIVDETVKAQIQKLENEKNLKYQAYSAVTQKLQAARAKLQESTPVITVLQGASVPVKPAGPKRMLITLGILFLAYIAVSIYLLEKAKK